MKYYPLDGSTIEEVMMDKLKAKARLHDMLEAGHSLNREEMHQILTGENMPPNPPPQPDGLGRIFV